MYIDVFIKILEFLENLEGVFFLVFGESLIIDLPVEDISVRIMTFMDLYTVQLKGTHYHT